MHHWTKRIFAAAGALLLTGCLWGPGKFTSELTVRKNGTFVLDYRGQILLQLPPDEAKAEPWQDAFAHCFEKGEPQVLNSVEMRIDATIGGDGEAVGEEVDKPRACTPTEVARLRTQYEREEAERVASKRRENDEILRSLGLPGLDDASNQAFAARMMKQRGWRSVRYVGNGVFDVDYHLEGTTAQDYVFPMMPDAEFMIPFVAIRRRNDGSVLVSAPAFTGGSGLGDRLGRAAAMSSKDNGPRSRAEGSFTVVTDGEILTNNSEDGPSRHPIGRQIRWDVTASTKKAPETLIRL